MLLLGMLAQTLIMPLSTLFVIRGDTVFPMKVGIANCLLNAVLDVILRGPLGVAGIALGTTLTLAILCVVYAWQARRRWGSLHLGAAVRPLVLSLTSSVAIAGCAALIVTGEPAGA